MKQIYVQAQADHIESLFKGSPLAAIEELVWNALDADAKEVKVDLRSGRWRRSASPTMARALTR